MALSVLGLVVDAATAVVGDVDVPGIVKDSGDVVSAFAFGMCAS